MDERRVQGMSILLASDDSDAARAAESWVAALRHTGPYRVDVASVAGANLFGGGWGAQMDRPAVRQAVRELQESELRTAERVANAVGERLQQATDVTVRTWARQGLVAEELIALVEDLLPDLVVVGHRGRSKVAQLVMGSVANALIAHSPRPTLVVRTPAAGPAAPRHAVIAYDGTPAADRLVGRLAELGLVTGAEVTIVGLPDLPAGTAESLADTTPLLAEAITARVRSDLEAPTRTLVAAGATVAQRIALDHPLVAIEQAVKSVGADLLIMLRHRTPRGREALADQAARRSGGAVLVVPAG
jgi:nucleotide-binding universal stress UspA family protein